MRNILTLIIKLILWIKSFKFLYSTYQYRRFIYLCIMCMYTTNVSAIHMDHTLYSNIDDEDTYRYNFNRGSNNNFSLASSIMYICYNNDRYQIDIHDTTVDYYLIDDVDPNRLIIYPDE